MLSPNQIEYLNLSVEEKKKLSPLKRKDIHHNIRNQTFRALEHLTLLAQKLPEDQQKQIFTETSLRRFLETVVTLPESLQDEFSLIKDDRRFQVALMIARTGIYGIEHVLGGPLLEITRQSISPTSRLLQILTSFLEHKKKHSHPEWKVD